MTAPTPKVEPPQVIRANGVAAVPRLKSTISIKQAYQTEVKAPQLTIKEEVKPLTQQSLEEYWRQTAEELELTEVMNNANLRLGEKTGFFEVDATTTYFDSEFKPHRTKVMQLIRQKCGMPTLDCKVNPLFVEEGKMIYSAEQHFEFMSGINPAINHLRRVLPTIEVPS